jgi:hypothetical protein
MKALAIGLLAASLGAPGAHAQSPAAKEMIAWERKAAMHKCLWQRDYFELQIASAVGNPRAIEIRKRMETARRSPLEGQAQRVFEGESSLAEPDRAALAAVRSELRQRCAWRRGSLPPQLPPAASDEEARNYAIMWVPLSLKTLRICEVMIPEMRGKLESAWAASRFRELDIPAMHEMVEQVRPWMKTGYEAKVPHADEATKATCAHAPGELKRIEKALPEAFFTKQRRR